MKNKTTGLPNANGFMTYADLAMDVINRQPQGGFDLNEMEFRLEMKKKLKAANGNIELNEDEFKKLKELTAVHTWGLLHDDLVDFCNTVKELK